MPHKIIKIVLLFFFLTLTNEVYSQATTDTANKDIQELKSDYEEAKRGLYRKYNIRSNHFMVDGDLLNARDADFNFQRFIDSDYKPYNYHIYEPYAGFNEAESKVNNLKLKYEVAKTQKYQRVEALKVEKENTQTGFIIFIIIIIVMTFIFFALQQHANKVKIEKEKEEKEKENEKILRKAGEDVKDIKNKPLNHTTVKVAGNVEGHMIINSTLINSLNNNENISADIKEAIEKVAEIVQESQEPLAKNYFDKFMQRIVDKEEPDEIESMWNKIVKTIPAIKDMGDVVTKIATLF